MGRVLRPLIRMWLMPAMAVGSLLGAHTAWAAQAFQESAGQVVIEAERYDNKIARNSKDWTFETTVSGYSATGHMRAMPNGSVVQKTNYTTLSPELIYNVSFTTAGTYYVWARGAGSVDDSYHIGIDNTAPASGANAGDFGSNWSWNSYTTAGRPTLTVSSPGLHTIHIWMRHDGFPLDKLLLRTDASLTAPSGTGPAESARVTLGGDTTPPSVSLTAPGAGATVSGAAVTVSANASDNVGVVGVQFKLDGANLGAEDTSSPYSVSWNTTTATNGSHTLTAVARDAAGNSTTSGGVAVTVNNAAADTTPPTISNIGASGVTQTAATITWTTNEASTSQINYGTTTGYGQSTTLNSALVTGHSHGLSGLTASTLYHYRVRSKDAAGNEAVSADGTFTTAAPPASATTVTLQRGVLPTTAYTDMSDGMIAPSAASTVRGNVTVLYLNLPVNNRGICYFNLNGVLPAGASVTQATLRYDVYQNSGLNATVGVYQVRTNWLGGASWQTPGGDWTDQNGTAQGAVPFANVLVNASGPVTWDVTTIVQRWVSGAAPNYGLLLKVTGTTNGYALAYGSAHAASNRPRLTITYSTAPVINSFTVSPSARAYISQPTTLSVSASSANPMQYQFLKDGAVICPWSSSSSCQWTAAAGDVGMRSLEAQVKDTATTTPVTRSASVYVIHEPMRAPQ